MEMQRTKTSRGETWGNTTSMHEVDRDPDLSWAVAVSVSLCNLNAQRLCLERKPRHALKAT